MGLFFHCRVYVGVLVGTLECIGTATRCQTKSAPRSCYGEFDERISAQLTPTMLYAERVVENQLHLFAGKICQKCYLLSSSLAEPLFVRFTGSTLSAHTFRAGAAGLLAPESTLRLRSSAAVGQLTRGAGHPLSSAQSVLSAHFTAWACIVRAWPPLCLLLLRRGGHSLAKQTPLNVFTLRFRGSIFARFFQASKNRLCS
ncbi:unnamed protein product [Protopolystoma xenopodis]|uniref:Secreted protein n=1 Tax=Protopolystoma xenopodis TaxID=117903 RepID=A0A3S5BY15_9PLAT|nr:unnamed protein product [Protopolystoma xenopodis]